MLVQKYTNLFNYIVISCVLTIIIIGINILGTCKNLSVYFTQALYYHFAFKEIDYFSNRIY